MVGMPEVKIYVLNNNNKNINTPREQINFCTDFMVLKNQMINIIGKLLS